MRVGHPGCELLLENQGAHCLATKRFIRLMHKNVSFFHSAGPSVAEIC